MDAASAPPRRETPRRGPRVNTPATQGKPVIVGYDGSSSSRRAVLWAVHHAAVTGLPLVVLHCWMTMFTPKELGYVPDARDDALRAAAKRTAAKGLDLAKQAEPEVAVSAPTLVVGNASEVLTQA